MPRNTSNFWGEITTENRIVATGPKSRSSRMKINLFIREKNNVSPLSLHVECVPFADEKGVDKNRVIVYFDGPGLERVEVRPEAKQMTLLLEA